MADNPCTQSTFQRIFSSSNQNVTNPIVQVLQVKSMAAQPNAPERYRLVLSDSSNFVQAMLATQMNSFVTSGEIQKGCFIQLNVYQANLVKDRKILIVVDMALLKHLGVREKVGTPVAMDEGGAAPQQQQQQAQPASANATSFYGNKPAPVPAPVQRPTGGGNSAPARQAATETHANIYPIEAISPYQNKWTVKARVTYKSEIKHWNNSKSEGKLFTVHFLDETGEIRATGFNAECDNFYEVLQEGQVYYISKCRVNMAKKQFSNVNNDYELTLQRDTEIEQCHDDSVPQMKFNFVPIASLDAVEKDAIIDVLGVVKQVGDVDEIISKTTSKPYSKRDITIVDKTNAFVRCTVWGNNAKNWDVLPDSVVAFKGVKVSDFNGRSLSMLYSSAMTPSPDIDMAHELKGWYDSEGHRDLSTYTSHQALATVGSATGRNDPYKNLAQVRDENLGTNDAAPDYFTLKAVIVYIKHDNISYPACLSESCNKKVTQTDDESWKCERCDINHQRPQWRYIMTISVQDAFGQQWLSCFDDVGRMIMGRSADELHELEEKSQPDDSGSDDWKEYKKQFDAAFTNALCQTYVFRCRAKPDTFGDVQRVRFQVMSANTLNYGAEAAKLVQQIKLYDA